MPLKKADENKNKKLLKLYSILMFSGVEHSLTTLAQRLQCSKQTILRYIDDIEMSAKGELVRWKGDDGQAYYKMKAPPVKPRVALSPEHIQHLLMCHDLLTHLLPKGLMDEVADTIDHTTVLLADFEERDKALRSLFAVKPADGRIDYTPQEMVIETLKRGMKQSKICNISYESSLGGAPLVLSITPLVLFSYKGGLYLKVRKMEWKDSGFIYLSIGRMTGAFLPQPKDTEILAVHRILEVKITEITFEPEKERTHNEQELFGMGLEKPFRVKVAFSPLVANFIRKRNWSSNQEVEEHTDGSITLSMVAGNRDEIFSWLLSFGLQARVIEPEELCLKMMQHADEFGRLYDRTRHGEMQ